MILVDTSVWVDHLRKGDDELRHLLSEGLVLAHPFVIGELACGNLRQRSEVLTLTAALPSAELAKQEEVLALLSERKLHGKGLGWVDAHLLASAVLSACSLWTRDKALAQAASSMDLGV